jgi:hypothetical protein
VGEERLKRNGEAGMGKMREEEVEIMSMGR